MRILEQVKTLHIASRSFTDLLLHSTKRLPLFSTGYESTENKFYFLKDAIQRDQGPSYKHLRISYKVNNMMEKFHPYPTRKRNSFGEVGSFRRILWNRETNSFIEISKVEESVGVVLKTKK